MLCDFLVGPIDCSLVPHRLPWTAIYFPMFLILSICKASRIDEAIQRMQIVVLDSYDNVSVFSIYWKSVDNGGAEDTPYSSKLFRSYGTYKHASKACPMTIGLCRPCHRL